MSSNQFHSRILVLLCACVTMPIFCATPAQFSIETGIVSSYFDLNAESAGSSQGVQQFAITLSTERFLPIAYDTGNFFNFRAVAAPTHNGGERLTYGFYGLGTQFTHQASSGWWKASLGLDLRQEQYSYTDFFMPDGQGGGVWVPKVKGTMMRPWVTLSFSYCGVLVPFRTHTRLEPTTRFECSQAFLTPSASGAEEVIRKSSEQLQGSCWVGIRF